MTTPETSDSLRQTGDSTAQLPPYIVVTTARNEAHVIGFTLDSMAAQTVKPAAWVIVSDGSTDRTDDLVAEYAKHHPWITLVRRPERTGRDFAGKVHAFNAGYNQVRHLDHVYVVCLDADVSFEPDYFQFLLHKAEADSRLGIVGTAFRENRMAYDYRYVSIEHVSGPCQCFRRECFEDIGGYRPLAGGGVDHVAVLSARMKGWKTRCFPEKVYQHRDMGSARHGPLRYKYVVGRLDHALGSHPLWELCRVMYQMTRPPLLLGGMMIGAGYLSRVLSRSPRTISDDLVTFRQREQMSRIKTRLGISRSHIPG